MQCQRDGAFIARLFNAADANPRLRVVRGTTAADCLAQAATIMNGDAAPASTRITHHCDVCSAEVDPEGHCPEHPKARVSSVLAPGSATAIARVSLKRVGYDHHNPRHVSIAPLDVGFDPREHGMPVALPADVVLVRYARQDGEIAFATGTLDEIQATLEAAGYTITAEGGQ
jgi:hypothetical protein